MRTKTFGAVTLSAFVLLAGVAVADKKIQLEGGIKGDSVAEVELKVIKTDGEVEAVKGINFRELLIDCEGGSERVKLRPRGKVLVNERGRFKRAYDAEGGGQLRMRGNVLDDGHKAKGTIETGKPISFNGMDCEVPKSKFKVSK